MAHKKGVGSSKNGRESESKRLGVKIFGGQFAKAGYGASLKYSNSSSSNRNSSKSESSSLEDTESPKMKKRLIASVIFLIPLMYVSMGHMLWNWPLPSFLDGNHVAMGLYELFLPLL